MSGDPDLLRLLSGGASSISAVSRVRPVGPSHGSAAAGIDAAEFADLLKRAQNGEISTGLPISIDKDADVTISETDMMRLSSAADKAEAAGIRRALVFTDSGAMILDVQTRTIVGKADLKDGIASGIDGVIRLGNGPAEVTRGDQILPVPPSNVAASNPSLASLLNDRRATGA